MGTEVLSIYFSNDFLIYDHFLNDLVNQSSFYGDERVEKEILSPTTMVDGDVEVAVPHGVELITYIVEPLQIDSE